MRQLTFAASLAGLMILSVLLAAANLFDNGPFDPPSAYYPGGAVRIAAELPGK